MALYTVFMPLTLISTAKTLIQIKAGSNKLTLYEARIGVKGALSSVNEHIGIIRTTTAATVTSATPQFGYASAQDASLSIGGTAATGYNATAEGTPGITLIEDTFNILTGWREVMTVLVHKQIRESEFIALKFLSTPAAGIQCVASLTFDET